MEYCTPDSRCLICFRATHKNSSVNSGTLVSNVSLLQDFLHCFRMNVLDSEVHDLSTSCHFCPICEQFIAEWSNTQKQMTQLTRRAAQLKATLSALLLSAPQVQKQNHDEDVTEIINHRIQNSQEVKLPLLLQQAVGDIRNELRKKYYVNVMVDKIQLPCPPSQLNPEEFAPLTGHSDNDDEPMDDLSGDDDSDAEYLPSEDQMDDEDTPEQIFEIRIKTKEEVCSDDSNGDDSVELKEMKLNRKRKPETKVGSKSRTDSVSKGKRKRSPSNQVIPDGPNRFTYKGMSFQLNEEDQTYTCDACGFKSAPKILYIKRHLIRHLTKLLTEKEKRPNQPKIVVPDGPNTFNYNGHGLKLNDEDQCYYCGACDFKGNSNINSILLHFRELHYTEEDKVKFTAVKASDTEWLYGGQYKILRVGEKFKCVSCGCVIGLLENLILHIRTHHIDMEGPEEVVPLPATDTPSVNDLAPTEGVYQSVPYTFNPANNKYTCGVCQSQISTSRKNLGRHIKERHTDAALKVICEICGKELLNQRSYQSHLKKHQTEPKSCPTCDKKFHDERHFNRHLKIHALGEAAKKYQCEYCGKKFYLRAQYRSHVLSHTREKPYECHACGEKFRHSSVLSNHRHSVHGLKRGDRKLMRVNE